MRARALLFAMAALGCGDAEVTLDIQLPKDKRLLAAVTTLDLAATRDGVELAHNSFSSTAGTVSLAGVSHGARTIFTLEGVGSQGTVVAQGKTCAVDFEGPGTVASLYFAPTTFFGATANDPTVARATPAAMALDDGTALIAGGTDGTVPVASVDLFTPGTTTFADAPTPVMNHARTRAEATPLASIGLLVTGGVGADGAPLGSGEIFLESGRQFLATGPAISPRVEHRAVLLPDGRALLTGGRATADGPPLATTQFVTVKSDGTFQVSPESGSTAGPTLVEARRSHAATVTVGTPIVFGGYGADDKLLDSIETIDPGSSGVATTVAHLQTARAEATASLLVDGSILLVGGVGPTGALADAEVYNPLLPKRATTTYALAVARHGHTATVLADGRVLVAGGAGADGSALTSVELFDPGVGFVTERSLTTARSGHVAVPLCDGTVLLVGGGASAELYTPAAD
jgi:Galactose oxidase, central domain